VDIFDGQEICRTNFTLALLKHDPEKLREVAHASGICTHGHTDKKPVMGGDGEWRFLSFIPAMTKLPGPSAGN